MPYPPSRAPGAPARPSQPAGQPAHPSEAYSHPSEAHPSEAFHPGVVERGHGPVVVERGHGPVVHPGVVRRGYTSPQHPPPAYQRHRDYNYVEGYGWWPTWFPYWDETWLNYWNYFYDYYGGDAYPDYAEYARDEAMRQIAIQQGWL